jgi:hypothetical protein
LPRHGSKIGNGKLEMPDVRWLPPFIRNVAPVARAPYRPMTSLSPVKSKWYRTFASKPSGPAGSS